MFYMQIKNNKVYAQNNTMIQKHTYMYMLLYVHARIPVADPGVLRGRFQNSNFTKKGHHFS